MNTRQHNIHLGDPFYSYGEIGSAALQMSISLMEAYDKNRKKNSYLLKVMKPKKENDSCLYWPQRYLL